MLDRIKDTIWKNLWDDSKAVLREKLNAYTRSNSNN